MLDIRNRGQGKIGDIDPGWIIEYAGSPMIVGQSVGRLGSVSFHASCDETTKFTIDDYCTVRHFFDDEMTRHLSSFDGHIRQMSTDDKYGDFLMVSFLSALDCERTSLGYQSGQYQRQIRLPQQQPYVISSTTYYTGGFFQPIGGVQTWNPRPIPVYDVTCDKDSIYVLAGGGHNGEVVFHMGIDGTFRSVWPVHSDANDVANPQSRCISYADGYVWIGQVGFDRIKRFSATGTFVTQWGGPGTGNGQFGTISSVASSGYGLNAVYVSDSQLGRVQWFTDDGSYLGQFGTQGTGTGDLVFNAPFDVTIEPDTDNLFVSDQNARVREYTQTGQYIGQPMGSYDVSTAKSRAEFLKGNHPIATAFDSKGNAYAIQRGIVYKFARTNTGWPSISSFGRRRSIQQWNTKGVNDANPPTKICASHESGIIHIAREFDYVEQWAGTMGTLQAWLLYYVGLALGDFPVKFLPLNDEWQVNELAFIPWTGNVWEYLGQCCAATGNAMFAFDDKLYFGNRNKAAIHLPHDTLSTPLELDSRGAGLAVTVVSHNARNTIGEEVVYTSQADDQRQITVGLNDFVVMTVQQDTYTEYIRKPIASTTTGAGLYTVIDKDGQLVDPPKWNAFGGAIVATTGFPPGTINITITGPYREIPDRLPPYRIADTGGTPSLSLLGRGIITAPEILTVGTGLSPLVTSREIAQHIDSPFCITPKIALSEATWSAYHATSPHQRIKFSFSNRRTFPWRSDAAGIDGTGWMVSSIVQWKDAQYVVENVEATADRIILSCFRYTKTGMDSAQEDPSQTRFETIWAAKKASEFDGFWAFHTAQDVTIAPLRNPFGL